MKKNFLFVCMCMLLFSATAFGQKSSRGKASYYAHFFHGRKTSSGSIYDKNGLTCAHRTLPFGTLLKVRNVANNKEVVVKVTDRGPFVASRDVDLSYAAARKLDFINDGLAHVEITQLNGKGGDIISPYRKPKDTTAFASARKPVRSANMADVPSVKSEIAPDEDVLTDEFTNQDKPFSEEFDIQDLNQQTENLFVRDYSML